jgi:hypothetical protein
MRVLRCSTFCRFHLDSSATFSSVIRTLTYQHCSFKKFSFVPFMQSCCKISYVYHIIKVSFLNVPFTELEGMTCRVSTTGTNTYLFFNPFMTIISLKIQIGRLSHTITYTANQETKNSIAM